MNIQASLNTVSRLAGRSVLKVKKVSPTLMFGAGVVGVVATVVLASKATLKLEETLDATQENLDKANSLHESNHPKYSEQDFQKDRVIIYVQAVKALGKLYGPALIVGITSIGLLTGAHVTLNRRNTGLMAAYAALDKGFREYRERVVADTSVEKDREYYYGADTVDIYEEASNGEPKIVQIKRATSSSIYGRVFDSSNENWNNNMDNNITFLRMTQDWMNGRLNRKGVVMLNDVYDKLGLPRTSAGAVVGWVHDSETGDGHIDFGIWDEINLKWLVGEMGGADGIVLDFNVDGVVYNLIDKKVL